MHWTPLHSGPGSDRYRRQPTDRPPPDRWTLRVGPTREGTGVATEKVIGSPVNIAWSSGSGWGGTAPFTWRRWMAPQSA